MLFCQVLLLAEDTSENHYVENHYVHTDLYEKVSENILHSLVQLGLRTLFTHLKPRQSSR